MSQEQPEELRRQLDTLEKETLTLNKMTGSLDDLQIQLDNNRTARERLRRKLLDTGYRM